jgi:cytochrome o ubiquinol oxidase subunit 2
MSKKGKGFWTPGRVLAHIFVGVGALVVLFALLMYGKDIPVFSPSGPIATQEKNLILFTVLLSVVVVVPVFLMLAIISIRYRENGGKGTYTPDEEDNHWFEALWWGIPIAIIGLLGIVTVISTHQLDPMKPLASNVAPLNVEVVALQWRWLFIYPDQGVASMNELHVPVGTPIHFSITADGPMSGFWIPALGTQTYAMPGMSMSLNLQADKVGSYRGSNSNISGTGYADMNFQTIVAVKSDFDLWADTIKADESHKHMDWTTYQAAAKPVRDKHVYYYHLHDASLYTEIIDKFMGGHGGSTASHDHGGDE